VVNFEFFSEGRWKWLGTPPDARWKAWLTLTGGVLIESSVRTTYQTQFEDSSNYIIDANKYALTFKTRYRTEPYLAPGLLIGIGNFTIGYRHFVYFEDIDPAQRVSGQVAGNDPTGLPVYLVITAGDAMKSLLVLALGCLCVGMAGCSTGAESSRFHPE